MKNLKILFACVVFIILVDFLIPVIHPLTNENNYLLGFEKVYNKALETQGADRILLVGGSSLGWGVAAKVLSERLRMPVLNAGIHAGIGYKNFLRTLGDRIDKSKDIIVISPEYSLVSSETGAGRSSEFCFISIYVKRSYPLSCIGFSVASVLQIVPLINSLKDQDSNSDYLRSGFNEVGDYIYRRAGVSFEKSADFSDPCSGWLLADLHTKYVPFIDGLSEAGYEIIYIPTLVPSGSCSNPDKIYEFHKVLHKRFGVSGFQQVTLTLEEELFYNTEYHLTHEGVRLKTAVFEHQLRKYLQER